MAKIASDRQKPDGLTLVTEKEAKVFLEPLSIRKIPGVGPRAEEQLNKLGITTIKDLKKLSLGELDELMGKWGRGLYERARGRDDSPVSAEWETKSIGEQETFPQDSSDPAFLMEQLTAICRGVHNRFQRSGFKTFRSVTVTVRFRDFTTKTRTSTLKGASADLKDLEFGAFRLFLPFLDARENPNRKAIRLLGVRVEKLT